MTLFSKFLCLPGIFFLVTRFGVTSLKQRALDAYHASGRWAFLKNSAHPEMVKLVERYARGGRVLDCGSGTGAMAAALPPSCYSEYHGVELASAGVAYARARGLLKSKFFCADMELFHPDCRYDLIFFEETLYYLSAASRQKTFKRYVNLLNPGGVAIVTVADPDRFAQMLNALRRDYRVLEDATFPNAKRVFLVLS